MEQHQERIVKVPLPVTIIRQIDEAIVAGLGGYSTRTEFFRDAAEGLLLELKYAPAPAEPVADHGIRESVSRAAAPADEIAPPASIEPIKGDAAATVLLLEHEGHAMSGGVAEVDDEPLFGMHNRDYPSLWVAFRLAERAVNGPVAFEAFLDEVIKEAWDYADSLRGLEESAGQKLTALFPTNRAKPQSAADAFRAFAVGTVTNGKDGRLRAEGPLFSWRACQVRAVNGKLVLGLTADGWRLLRALNGLSLALPHAPELARTFLQHLRHHSPGDWWGFFTVLKAVAEEPNRLELVDAFQGARPDWSTNVAGTNAQGYVARAREWGLVEPKQVAHRYGLTDFGNEYLAQITDGDHQKTKSEGEDGNDD